MKIFPFLKKYSKYIYESLGVIFLLVLVEIIAILINDPLLFPGIDKIFLGLGTIMSNKSFYLAFFESFLRTFIAIFSSFILAFVLGLIAGLFSKVKYFLSPLVGLLKLVPTPCIVFVLFLVSKGDAYITSLVITFLVVFPILYQSFVSGIENIDPYIKSSLAIEGFYTRKTIFNVIVPQASPYLLLGVLNSLALGVKVSIVSEILVGSDSIRGLGRLIYAYKIDANFDLMIAMTLIIVIFFAFIDLLTIVFKKILKK